MSFPCVLKNAIKFCGQILTFFSVFKISFNVIKSRLCGNLGSIQYKKVVKFEPKFSTSYEFFWIIRKSTDVCNLWSGDYHEKYRSIVKYDKITDWFDKRNRQTKYLQFWLPKLYYFEIILFVYFISCWAKFQYLKISTPRYFGIFCQNSQIYTEKAYVTILDIKKVKIFLKFVNISWIILLLQLWYCETPRRVNLFASGWTRPLRPLSDLCTGPK